MKTEFGDYDSMYGGVDYTDAVVLDIGADYGTTARYFFSRGASQVIVSERNPLWRAKLKTFAEEDARLTVIEVFTTENATTILALHQPDVVKVDCEGCEKFLFSVHPSLMAKPRAWVMETHTRLLYDKFCTWFSALGYEVETVEDWPETPKRCIKVIKAVRSHD